MEFFSRSYLREYGKFNNVQKNDEKAGDIMKELEMKTYDEKNKTKNEIHQIIHQEKDVNCEYWEIALKR